MKLLLDTHTLLWYVAGAPQLSKAAAALVVDPANEIFLRASGKNESFGTETAAW